MPSVQTLIAGRALDALMAERVLGLDESQIRYEIAGVKYISVGLPDYSTSLADAWLVVERLMEDGSTVEFSCCTKDFDVLIFPHAPKATVHEAAETLPLAICLAALKAVGA